MALTDSAVRSAKPRERMYRLADERGLFLQVEPRGGRLWRFRYRFRGREKMLSLGSYPDVSLKRAREKRDEARMSLTDGVDPAVDRKQRKANQQNGFETVGREWLAKQAASWTEGNTQRVTSRLERWAFPWLGRTPVAEITAADILHVLRRIEDNGTIETAHRIRGYCSQILRFAVVTGRAEHDVASALGGALKSVSKRHHAAITDPKRLGELLRAMQGFQGSFVVACALRLTPYLFVRPGELRRMEWTEVDFETQLWTLSAEKMKSRRDHLVPLADQSLAILRELEPLTGRGRYVFPSERGRGRSMSENTINAVLRRLGFGKEEVSAHGFRATARTLLDEVLGERPDIIEHQLAHAVRDPNGRAYNRTAHLDARRVMMQRWADYLDGLRDERREAIDATAA